MRFRDKSASQEGGKNLTKNELLSEFERWANDVLTEYIRLLKISRLDADSKTSGYVLSIQKDYQKLATGLRDIVLELYPANLMLPNIHIMHSILRPFLLNCIGNLDDPKVDKLAYSRLVDDVNFLINLKLDKNRAWAFLHQFGCLSDNIELEGPLRIRRATLIELYIFNMTNQSVGGRTRCGNNIEYFIH
ncbi:MAG: hypothetical protein E4H14_10325 [Candidatus Thorarchaeota archaeon]|nr:MAG: hypothetical protein E4H14_10325 [Candidatus Thorarchaeota archaeon]